MKINNKEEFTEFYPYEEKYIDEYPTEYPCVCKVECEGGGLAGDYNQVYVAYYPKNMTSDDSFLMGLYYKWNPLK